MATTENVRLLHDAIAAEQFASVFHEEILHEGNGENDIATRALLDELSVDEKAPHRAQGRLRGTEALRQFCGRRCSPCVIGLYPTLSSFIGFIARIIQAIDRAGQFRKMHHPTASFRFDRALYRQTQSCALPPPAQQPEAIMLSYRLTD